MSQTAHTPFSPTSTLVQLTIAALLGLVLLPTLLGPGLGAAQGTGSTVDPLSVLWLVVAIGLVVWLFVVVVQLTRFLETLLSQSPVFRVHDASQTSPNNLLQTRLLSILPLGIGYVLISEAILRRPLSAVLGVYVEPSLVDAIVATIALVLVFALLIGFYRAARPLIKATTWYVLDGVLATSGSDRVQQFYAADETQAAATAVAAGATQLAEATVANGEATVLASDERNVRAPFVPTDDGDVTRLAPREDIRRTQLAPGDGTDATQLAPTDDNTVFPRQSPANPTPG